MACLTATRVLALRPGPLQASGTPAYYLVLEQQNDGAVQTLYSTIVNLHGPLHSLSSDQMLARLAMTERSTSAIAVIVRDASGQSVYQDTVFASNWLRGEFHADNATEPGIDGHFVSLSRKLFVARVPMLPGTQVLVQPGLDARPTTLNVNPAAVGGEADTVASASAVVLWDNGDPANRVDMLVLGDGYTSDQQSKFQIDSLAVVNSFFSITPYREYRNYVNVSILFVPSAQSGADQPPYYPSCAGSGRAPSCCTDAGATGLAGRFVDTAFDGTYCSYGIERLLTVDYAKVLAAAAAAPDWDKIIVLVNSPVYGGSGGAVAVLSTDSSATEILKHEYGHSFTRLADEYDNPYPGYAPCSDFIFGMTPCEPNVTDQTIRSSIKWNRWIAASTPIPSRDPPAVETDAGLWKGARYLPTMYRQGDDCMMRSLGHPFCDVASEAYVLRLYAGDWGVPSAGIDNIEPGTEIPPPGNADGPGTSATFSAQVIGPVEGPNLSVNWYLDSGLTASSSTTPGSNVAYTLVKSPGPHTLTLEVIDNSPIIHPSLRASQASYRTWNLVSPPPPATPTTTATPTNTATTRPTATQSPTATQTMTRSATATGSPTNTATVLPTSTYTVVPTDTAVNTPAHTPTLTASVTPTDTPTAMPGATLTLTPNLAPTATPGQTVTSTASGTPTDTVTARATPTFTPTNTAPRGTPSQTATASGTMTKTPTAPASATQSSTATVTQSPSRTGTPTQTPTTTPRTVPSSTPTLVRYPGDVNCDGRMSAADAVALVPLSLSGKPGNCGAADVNQDGRVNLNDLGTLIETIWGDGPPIRGGL